MQQAGGEGIAGAGGIGHGHRKGGQNAAVAAKAPAQRGASIAHHHHRPLGQGGTHRRRIGAAEQPFGLLAGALDQGGLLQQRPHRRDRFRTQTTGRIGLRIPEGGPPVHIKRQGHAGRRGLPACELQG